MHHKNRQLQRLCILIGYMQGQLHDREEQLKVLPDLRYKAALSVARGLEAERANEKIRELEDALRRLSLRSHSKLEEMLKALSCSIESDDAAITILNCLGLIGLSGILWTIIFGF